MAEIEEIKIEKIEAEEMRIDNQVQMTKVYVGGGDDFIVVSGNDISIIDRFLAAGEELESLAGELDKNESEIGENDYKKEMEARRKFSEKATEIMDNVFGNGTTRKFFGDVYDVIPNFQPDAECFLDFWNKLIPVIERLSEHKIKLEKLASKQRMSKYQPQDHKKPSKKAYAKAGMAVYSRIPEDKS